MISNNKLERGFVKLYLLKEFSHFVLWTNKIPEAWSWKAAKPQVPEPGAASASQEEGAEIWLTGCVFFRSSNIVPTLDLRMRSGLKVETKNNNCKRSRMKVKTDAGNKFGVDGHWCTRNLSLRTSVKMILFCLSKRALVWNWSMNLFDSINDDLNRDSDVSSLTLSTQERVQVKWRKQSCRCDWQSKRYYCRRRHKKNERCTYDGDCACFNQSKKVSKIGQSQPR